MESMKISQVYGQGLNFHVDAFKSSNHDFVSPISRRSRTFH